MEPYCVPYLVTLFGFAFAKQLQTYLYMTVKQHAYQDVAAKVRMSTCRYPSSCSQTTNLRSLRRC
jgi:putative component of membrane protein insertase Oxa1/YidC/SpoIIIJ protein YidD